MSGGLEAYNNPPPKEPVVRGEMTISFENICSVNNRWDRHHSMLRGEWEALQIMKKLIRLKFFPIVYRELPPKAWDESWYRGGFSRILITYGQPLAEQSLRSNAALRCNCRFSDAWRCAVHENLHGHVACDCLCHSTFGRSVKWRELRG